MIIWRENKKSPKKKREALVDTNQCEEPKGYSSSAVLVRTLRDKLASELSAANEYSKTIDSLNATLYLPVMEDSSEAYKIIVDIINKIAEVQKDEENHAGVLLQCIQMLDPEVIKNGVKGFRGEEAEDGK